MELIKRPLRQIYRYFKSNKARKAINKNFKIDIKSENINVIFICQVQHIWNKILPLVEYMRRDDKFKITLFVVNDEKEDNTDKNIFIDYAVKNELNYLKYKEGLLKDLKADYVIYPRPYDVFLPEDIRSPKAVKYARLAYIPYGYSTMELGSVNLNSGFIRNIALFFADMDYSFKYFNSRNDKNIKNGTQHSFNLGYPYLEYLSNNLSMPLNNSLFGLLPKNRLKVLWTPRWTVDDKLGGSNFFRYIDNIFENFVNNEKFAFVFRPHPYAFDNYVKLGLITEERKQKYLDTIYESDNSKYDFEDDYFDTLRDADVAIMDISSIIPERFITGKPIIFCHNLGGEILNDKMKEMLQYMYNAYSFEDIVKIIYEISSGNDYLKDKREEYCRSFRKFMAGTCERISLEIKNDYESRLIRS